MIFSSHIFILLFLPVMLLGYFLLGKCRQYWPAKLFLVCGCFFFYGWFNISYLPLIFLSIGVNYLLGQGMFHNDKAGWRKFFLVLGILFNLGMLGYYKYADFFISNVNTALNLDIPTKRLLLPLGISFFTFQQLSYLVDVYRRTLQERYSLLTYSLFVTFFPQLIAGPIVMPDEMMPQFAKEENRHLSYPNLAQGFYLFSLGLAKKMLLADFFGVVVDATFAPGSLPNIYHAWEGAFAYNFQMYFDFSGYCDMALGLGLMFNIRLPINFDSPFRASTVAEFWKYWHITLGRFLMNFVYFPLGGSRCSEWRTALNLLITFVLCGLWHGAGWLFLFWGFLHGVTLVINRTWSKHSPVRLPYWLGVTLTFFFVVLSGTVFRCNDMAHVGQYFGTLAGFTPWALMNAFADISRNTLGMLIFSFLIIFLTRSAASRLNDYKPTVLNGVYSVVLVVSSIVCMSRISPFLYFNF